jgi:hypothetical protein
MDESTPSNRDEQQRRLAEIVLDHLAVPRPMFSDMVDQYLDRVRGAEGGERNLVAQEFEDDCKASLKRLTRELRRAGLDALCSKEGVAAVIAGLVAGTLMSPGMGTVIGLASGWTAYQRARREVLTKEWSSWIFLARGSRLTLV